MSEVSATQSISRQLTVAFLVCFAIGAATIKLSPLAPCVPLLAYAALGFFLTKDQKNSDRFADSLYYLGFLLTLVALLLALIGLESQPDPISVAKALGAGLSASILGLGLRVLLIQFRGTVSDQEEEARVSIEEQAREVKEALAGLKKMWHESTEAVGHLRGEIEQFRTDLQGLRKTTLTTAENRQKQLIETTTKALEAWDSELTRIKLALARVDIPEGIAKDIFTSAAKQLGAELGEATRQATRSIDEATTPLKKVGEASERCVARLEQLGSSLKDTIDACVSINGAAQALAKTITTSGDEAGKGLNSIKVSASQFEAITNAAVAALNRTTPLVDGVDRRAQAAAKALENVGADIKTVSDALVRDIEAVAGDLVKVRIATAELVDLARTEITKSA
jgi:membrane-associated HD superfamily phosphohydrolase